MKKNILALLSLTLLLSACGTLDPAGPYAGDKILYDADVAITTSYDVVHTFVLWEYTNRTALQTTNPGVKVAADNIRKNASQWFGTAIALRDAYRLQPGTTTRDALQSALLILKTAAFEATKYMVQYQNSVSQ
jgi:hypothetical protein